MGILAAENLLIITISTADKPPLTLVVPWESNQLYGEIWSDLKFSAHPSDVTFVDAKFAQKRGELEIFHKLRSLRDFKKRLPCLRMFDKRSLRRHTFQECF